MVGAWKFLLLYRKIVLARELRGNVGNSNLHADDFLFALTQLTAHISHKRM